MLWCRQDEPDQYCDGPGACKPLEDPRAHPGATPCAHPSPSSQSVQPKGGQTALLRSSSCGRWRPLSQQEASQKRAHQKTLLEAVKLLSSLLSSLRHADLRPDSAPPLRSAPSAADEHLAQSLSQGATPDSPMGKADVRGTHLARAPTNRAFTRLPDQATPGQRCLPQQETLPQEETLAAPILLGLCGAQELKGHVMAACQLVEPGMGYAGLTAANTGRDLSHVQCQH